MIRLNWRLGNWALKYYAYVKIENYSENTTTTTLLSSHCFIFLFIHLCVWMWFDVLLFNHHWGLWFSFWFFSFLTHHCWWFAWRRTTDWSQCLFFLILYTSWCFFFFWWFFYLYDFFCFDDLKDFIFLLLLFWLWLKLWPWLRIYTRTITTEVFLFLHILIIFFDFSHLSPFCLLIDHHQRSFLWHDGTCFLIIFFLLYCR